MTYAARTRDDALGLYSGGMAIRDVAGQLGLAPSTVMRWIAAAEQPARLVARPQKAIDEQRLADVLAGLNTTVLGARWGVWPSTAFQWITRHDLHAQWAAARAQDVGLEAECGAPGCANTFVDSPTGRRQIYCCKACCAAARYIRRRAQRPSSAPRPPELDTVAPCSGQVGAGRFTSSRPGVLAAMMAEFESDLIDTGVLVDQVA